MPGSSLLSMTAIINYLAAIHGFILAMIIHRKSHRRLDANIILSILLMFSSWMLAGATLYNGGGYRHWPHLILFFDPFVQLIPPLIYFYVSTRIHGPLHLRPKQALHLIPFIYNLITWLPFYLMSSANKRVFYLKIQHPHPLSWILLPRILVPTFYIILSLTILVRHTRSLKKTPDKAHRKNLKWLWLLLIGILLVWGIITFIHGYSPAQISEEEFSQLSNLLSSVFIFAMGYQVLLHPEILNRDIGNITLPKYQKTGISNPEVTQIWLLLDQKMKQEMLFLEPTLTLNKLSELMNLPQHQLSQVINQKTGTNFYSFLNTQRIDHAQKMMKNTPTSKLLSIAFSSGFQSLATFNRVFKEITRQTPSQYRNQLKKQ